MLEHDKHSSAPQGFFDGLPSKTSYVFGLVSGVAVTALLVIFMGGNLSLASGTSAETAVAPQAAQAPAAAPARAGGTPPPVTADDHIRGDKDAPISTVEYSDYECPFCARFHPTVVQILEEYAGQVNWVYRHFPLTSIHAQATPAAIAAECAGELGGDDAFWEMTDGLFTNQSSLGRATYERLAGDIGLSASKFSTCLDSGKYDQLVADQQASGAAAGVTGTPGSFIVDANGNAQLVPGALPYAQVKSIIDGLL